MCQENVFSEICRLTVMVEILELIHTILDDRFITKEDITVELYTIIRKTRLYEPNNFYLKEKAEN